VVIGDYFKLNYHRLLMVISGNFIIGYCWLFYYRPLVVILLLTIDDYSVSGYSIISYY
jgi:hypothetical protein